MLNTQKKPKGVKVKVGLMKKIKLTGSGTD